MEIHEKENITQRSSKIIGVAKSHIFLELFSIKILTKLSYCVYIFLDQFL
jgi:hypothetical protein